MTEQQLPEPRQIARRTVAIGLAAVLVFGTGAWVAADELGLVPASNPEPAATAAGATELPSEAPTAEPTTEPVMPSDDLLDEIDFIEPPGGGGGRNIVKLTNENDSDLRIKASVQLNRISRKSATPVNFARAWSSCTNCQTLAVALQLNLVKRGTPEVSPFNAAVAINFECTRCVTVAVAFQYTISVDDPKETPKDVSELIREMDREVRDIANDPSIGVLDAARRLDAVIARFYRLATSLDARRDLAEESTSPDASSAPTEPPPTTEPSAEPTDGGASFTPAPTSTAVPASASPTPSAPADSVPPPSP